MGIAPQNFVTCLVISVAFVCYFQIAETTQLAQVVDDGINFYCSYERTRYVFYGCSLYNVNVTTTNAEEVATFSGSHSPGKTNKDVEMIRFLNGTMFSLPNGIGASFENMKYLLVHCRIKFIKRSSFTNLKNLTIIELSLTENAVFDSDAFRDLPSLDKIIFKLGSVDLPENIFEENKNLTRIKFDHVHLEVLPKNLFRNNLMLEYVEISGSALKTLDESLFERNELLNYVTMWGNELEHLPRDLFKNNRKLEHAHFDGNKLKSIEIDFTQLEPELLTTISLYENPCINAKYIVYPVFRMNDLTGFQNVINTNCTG